MREKDKQEALALGLEPHIALYQSYKKAVYRKTALVNNEIAAMWGVTGTLFGNTGIVYLVTGKQIELVSPIKVSRIYKQQMEVMKQLFPILENYVDASYSEAVRMLQIAGFNLSEPVKMPPLNKEFIKFRMTD